jgi:hypothetical protein
MKGSSALWWIVGLAIVAVLALVIGIGVVCSSLIGGAGELASESLEVVQEEVDRTSITQREFESVKPRMGRSSVENDLGKSAGNSAGDFAAPIPREPRGTSCLYYFERGQSALTAPTYRFCFRAGRLIRKQVL